jgi:hypothetical protein
MTIGEIIRKIYTTQGVQQAEVDRRLGAEHDYTYKAMRTESMRTATAARILSVLGYRLVAMPSGKKLPDGAYEVDSRDWMRHRKHSSTSPESDDVSQQ